ncbi:MAG: hypothetical protein DID91_2727702645 [Candidatus Nitrotoga sp. MKT]|nr:MAG: hypothetical protein DID91_2727702645 [Candidatus Nitrotoga sp. MKT]
MKNTLNLAENFCQKLGLCSRLKTATRVNVKESTAWSVGVNRDLAGLFRRELANEKALEYLY